MDPLGGMKLGQILQPYTFRGRRAEQRDQWLDERPGRQGRQDTRCCALSTSTAGTSQHSWTTTTWTSLKHYVCSKRLNHRGLIDFPSETGPMLPVPNGTFLSRVSLVSTSTSSLLARPVGRELTYHHGRRQQLEPALTHRVSPGQPSEETESCIKL